MNNFFSDKVAVITGASGEIGLATAISLAKKSTHIALLDVNSEKLKSACKRISDFGVRAHSYVCDVTDAIAVKNTVEQVVGEFGNIDFLFNNAGYQGAFSPVHHYDEDDFSRVLSINVCGAFHVLKAVAIHMVQRGAGSIVNMSSMAGISGPPNMAAYSASKFAVIGLTQTAAKDLAPHGIRVNAISPGLIGPGYMWERQVQLQSDTNSQYFSSNRQETEQRMIQGVPMRRCGSIEEIPGAVCFLLSDASSYITGSTIPISGGAG